MPIHHINEIEKLIREGQPARALEKLRQMAGPQPTGWDNLVSQLQARCARLNQQEMAGTVSQEEAAL